MKNADKPINPAHILIKEGGNAFLVSAEGANRGNYTIGNLGLTKREHYTGLAMQGLLANPQYWKRVYKTLSSLKADKDSIECVFAQFSIKLADEILQQLEEK